MKLKVLMYEIDEFHTLALCEQKWAVRRTSGAVLNKNGFFQYEPLPSSRDDKFLKKCRFDTKKQALDCFFKLHKTINKGGGR